MILPRWISRLAAVMLLGGVILFAYGFVAAPLVSWYVEGQDSIAHARDLLVRYAQAGSTRAQLRAQLEALLARGSSGAGGIYLSGRTEALAAADLQNRVKSIVQAKKGDLRSIQTISEEAEGHFRPIRIRVQMAATNETLYRIFYELEAEKPHLFLDNIEVRTRLSGGTPEEHPVPQVRFDVFGYLSPEAE